MNRRAWIAPLVLALGLGGCDDLLTETPKSFLTTDSYYRTPADIESATLSAYQPITRGDVWEWWLVIDMELGSDAVRIHPDEPNFGTYHPGLFLWTPTDASVSAPWNGFYTSIYRANLVLDKAPKVEFPDPQFRQELMAEAKFIRGYSYLMLTKLYDDVPLLLSVEDHEKAVGTPRTPVEQVHAQVIQDLTEAERDLPEQPRAHGRASKAAAQMVLADLYQWRSSFLKKDEWAKVAEYAQKVLASPQWGLLDDYLSVFLPANKGNREVIWMVASSGVDGRTSTNVFCHWLPRALGFNTAGGCEVLGQPTQWMYESFVEGDYRKEVSYRTSGCSTDPNIGCITFDWPNVYKYRPSNNGVGGPSDVDFPLYRVAEAHLMLAEALNEMGNTAEAIQHVNHIRARARKGNGSENRPEPADLPTTLTKEQAREAIYMERLWELAHEGKRWFDLVRRDALEPGYWRTSIENHDPEVAQRGDLSPHRKRFPIPAREIELNPALTQNPGY